MKLYVLCDGSPATHLDPPATAPTLAIQAIDGLSKKWASTELFGFLELPLQASYYEPYRKLSILCAPRLTRRGAEWSSTEWCWTKIWEHDDWWESGWHPCNVASCNLLPDVMLEIKTALNPGRYKL